MQATEAEEDGSRHTLVIMKVAAKLRDVSKDQSKLFILAYITGMLVSLQENDFPVREYRYCLLQDE